jgi:peroxiredoxin family protein
VTSLPELRDMAIELDVKFLACLMSMDVMEISKEDLIDEVEDVVGAATFIAEAQESEIQLFI